MRPIAEAKNEIPSEFMFLKYNGSRHESGDLNYLSEGSDAGHLNATLVRKSAVTATHQLDPDMKGDLSVLMDHDVKTAKHHYRLLKKAQVSVKVSDYAFSLFSPKPTPVVAGESQVAAERLPVARLSSENKIKDIPTDLLQGNTTRRTVEEENDISAESEEDSSEDTNSVVPETCSSGRQILPDTVINILKKTCSNMIEKGAIINTDSINKALPENILKRYPVTTISRRIRYERLKFNQPARKSQ